MTDNGFQRDRPSNPVWGGLDGVSGLYGLSRSGASPSQRSLAASYPSASAVSQRPDFSGADFRPDPDGTESDARAEGRQVPTTVDSRQFSAFEQQQSSLILQVSRLTQLVEGLVTVFGDASRGRGLISPSSTLSGEAFLPIPSLSVVDVLGRQGAPIRWARVTQLEGARRR